MKDKKTARKNWEREKYIDKNNDEKRGRKRKGKKDEESGR